MTRFARAKGSKASNERKEEDPTPWHIMRLQLAEQLNKNDDLEKKSSFADNVTGTMVLKPEKEMWFEFNEFKFKKPSFVKDTKRKTFEVINSQNEKTGKKKRSEIKVSNILNQVCLSKIKENRVKTNTKPLQSLFKAKEGKHTKAKTKQKKLKSNINSKPNAKSQTKQKKNITESFVIPTNKYSTIVEENEDARSNNNDSLNKYNPINTTSANRKALKTNIFDTSQCTKTEQDQFIVKPPRTFNFETSETLNKPSHLSSDNSKHGKKESLSLKVTDGNTGFEKELQVKHLSHKNSRRSVHTIIANGRTIEIVKFEAFWIKKEDACKLKDLQKKLRHQKIPKEKIQTIIKLERRKAEKALSREKTNVCYHCRKFGHKFSECPEINDSSMSSSGICFKCGSTEHTHFECKVTQSQNFRYAVCFVCNEQGHIARQCSLNPQGQYPKGGSCHLCGEVTHLRKDCPKAFEENPLSFVTVEKINNVGLEDVSEIKTNSKKQNSVKRKVVLF